MKYVTLATRAGIVKNNKEKNQIKPSFTSIAMDSGALVTKQIKKPT
jgi:hypothetical protein